MQAARQPEFSRRQPSVRTGALEPLLASLTGLKKLNFDSRKPMRPLSFLPGFWKWVGTTRYKYFAKAPLVDDVG
jgi:hypothetical protein